MRAGTIVFAIAALCACGDASGSGGDAGTTGGDDPTSTMDDSSLHSSDASQPAASGKDASRSDGPDQGGSGPYPCPVDDSCENAHPGQGLACLFGACRAQSGACTPNSCEDNDVCVKNLRDYCPECSSDTGCIIPVFCEKTMIAAEDCQQRPDAGPAKNDASID